MENYLYISIVISVVALALIKYGKGTSNANYYLSSMAILAYFIPYPILAELVPKAVLIEPIIIAFSKLTSANTMSNGQLVLIDLDLWLKSSLSVLITIGALLFVKRIIKSVQWRNQIMNAPSLTLLIKSSSKYQLPIYSINQLSSGLLLGIVNPVIIISEKINDSKHIDLIIAHEKQHLKSNDNLRLLLLEVAQCLFWWNPLVRKLIHANRFYIEARCDENTSNGYGHIAYIEDLASLILSTHHDIPSNLVCSASSSVTNNIARIKLLKEKRKMTFKNKLTYTLIAFTTITTMSWNTLATATNSENSQQITADQKQLGALVDFDVNITNKKKANFNRTINSKMTFWVNFDKKTTLNIDENFTVNFKAKNLGESAFLEFELIESNAKTVSKPRLTVAFGQEAIIEIDNPQVSKYAYLIKTIPIKAYQP
jgi:beta-lactamase regulating signal transducer with metallopeptidase domain